MHLDAAQSALFGSLGKSPTGQQLLVLIQLEIDDCNRNLRKMTGDDLLREQGKARFLDEFQARLRFEPSQLVKRRHPVPFAASVEN